jgi:hypothetical protein
MNTKQQRLAEAVKAVLNCTGPVGKPMFDLIRVSHSVLKPAEGLIWPQVLDVIEEVTGENLEEFKDFGPR